MATKEKYTGYYSHKITLNKNTTSMLEFKENTPNYFRVSNNGTSTIYCSTSSYPTSTQYDFKVDGGQSKVFAEPYYRDRIYFYNPSTSNNIPVTVKSFSAEFDPSVFALGEIGLEVQGSVKTDGIIKGFETSLPSGYNTIGQVALREGFYHIGSVTVDELPTDTLNMKIMEVNNSLNTKVVTTESNFFIHSIKYLYSESDFKIQILGATETPDDAESILIKGGTPITNLLYFTDYKKIHFTEVNSPIYIMYIN